ncbi:MAG: glycosyltransferase family 4 protein [Spirochaetota bacterium]
MKATYTPYGGAEKFSNQLIDAFLGAGCAVNLLTLPGQDWPNRHPQLSITTLGQRSRGRIMRLVSFQKAVSRHVQSHSYVAIFGIDYTAGQTHLRAGGGTHRTFLRHRDEIRSVPARILRSFSIFHHLKLSYEKKAIESPLLKRLYCNSDMIRQEITASYHIPPQRIKVVHNGVEWQSFEYLFHHKDEIKKQLLVQHQLPATSHFLLFIGSGFERKGLQYAIQGMQYLPSEFHLLVVGKGKEKPYQKMASRLKVPERIHFLGPQEGASRYFTLADGFILPTHYDPFSNASLEALAMGVPVLTTDRNGCAEVIQSGETGVILSLPIQRGHLRQRIEDFIPLIQQSSNPAYRKQVRSSVQYLDFAKNLEKIVTDVLETGYDKNAHSQAFE